MVDAVFVLDELGVISAVNPAALHLLGYAEGELVGESIDAICADQQAVTRTMHRQLDHTGQELRREECDLIASDGSSIPVGISGGALLDADRYLVGVVLVARDLRETRALIAELEKARHRAEEAGRGKTAFLATMSHEVRTPMNAVLGLSELLLDTGLDANQQRLASTIRSAAGSLLTILDDVLDLSRIEAGRIELESIDFDLHNVIANAVGMFAATERRGVELSVDIADGVPVRAHGDPARLRQVLVNLLGNAVKFTESGRVELSAAATPRDGGGFTLEVAVTDTGVGIAPDRLGRLFDEFTQADTSISRSHGGSGLGLAICKRLVELMGGELRVESELGRGSRFSFSAALGHARDAAAETSTTRRIRGRGRRARGGRVLVAEDNPINQMVASMMLEKLGYQVAIAHDGVEAVAAVRAGHFDAVLMDCRMPRMDGYRATREIRALEGGDRIPIIALTASVLESDRQRCFAAGMDALVTKPFDRAELEAALAGTRPETIAPRPSEELDAWRLDELRAMDGGDAAFVEEMFATLLSDTGHSVEALRAADPAAAGDIGHRLKSSAAMLGARRLAEVFAAIEAATRSDEVDAAALGELIERIPREIRRARRAFAAYLVGLSKGPGPGQTGSHRTGDRTVAET
jgi:hypothetical protein